MSRNILVAVTSLGLAILPGTAFAQQMQHVSYKASVENSKYTQSLIINVGDVPDHIVRAFELHRTFPNDAPVINGLKLVDSWTRGNADLIGGNGTGSLYVVYVMENGDEFFARQNTLLQASGGKSNVTQVGFITGGTGKFAGMHGTIGGSSIIDLKGNTNEGQTEIAYSMTK